MRSALFVLRLKDKLEKIGIVKFVFTILRLIMCGLLYVKKFFSVRIRRNLL